MGFALLFSMTLMLFMSIPLISGSFAKRIGRPFLKWFLIGTVLPVISICVLFCLPDLSKEKELN